MKAKLKTTYDRYGNVVTGHIEDMEMYEDVKNGEKWWRNGLYQDLTHIRIPKEAFERLLELDRRAGDDE